MEQAVERELARETETCPSANITFEDTLKSPSSSTLTD
jgi:hypothetical protein